MCGGPEYDITLRLTKPDKPMIVAQRLGIVRIRSPFVMWPLVIEVIAMLTLANKDRWHSRSAFRSPDRERSRHRRSGGSAPVHRMVAPDRFSSRPASARSTRPAATTVPITRSVRARSIRPRSTSRPDRRRTSPRKAFRDVTTGIDLAGSAPGSACATRSSSR